MSRCARSAGSEEREREFLREVDIGLMPLPDNAWTRGKCAYKALQYMAAGIPVVADDVGVSAEVIGHEQGGLIADSHGDWTDTICAAWPGTPGCARGSASEGRERVARGVLGRGLGADAGGDLAREPLT